MVDVYSDDINNISSRIGRSWFDSNIHHVDSVPLWILDQRLPCSSRLRSLVRPWVCCWGPICSPARWKKPSHTPAKMAWNRPQVTKGPKDSARNPTRPALLCPVPSSHPAREHLGCRSMAEVVGHDAGVKWGTPTAGCFSSWKILFNRWWTYGGFLNWKYPKMDGL